MRKALAISVGLVFALACADSVTEPAADLPAPAFSAHSNGAVVNHDEIGCAVVDGSGNWFPGDFSLPCGTEVATFAGGMNASIMVRAWGAPNPTGKTVRWGPYNPGADWVASYPDLSGPPYPCFLLGTDYDLNNPLFTVKWKAHVTPSGTATLSCQYSEKWEFHCEDYGNCA